MAPVPITTQEVSLSTQEHQWARVRAQLEARLGSDIFKGFCERIQLATITENVIILTVSSEFLQNWVIDHYGELLFKLWENETGITHNIRIGVRKVKGFKKPVQVPEKPVPQITASKQKRAKDLFKKSTKIFQKKTLAVVTEHEAREPVAEDTIFKQFTQPTNPGSETELRFQILCFRLEIEQLRKKVMVEEIVLNSIAKTSVNLTAMLQVFQWSVEYTRKHGRQIFPSRIQSYLFECVDVKLRVADIQLITALHFGVPVSEILNNRRTRRVVRPRQIAMWLCRQLTQKSLPEIGRRFGGRDHTTTLHGLRKIDELLEKDSDGTFANTLTILRKTIDART